MDSGGYYGQWSPTGGSTTNVLSGESMWDGGLSQTLDGVGMGVNELMEGLSASS